MEEVTLGQKVRDRVTGFTGIATGVVHYLTGCHQVLVQPRCKDDGSFVDSMWMDMDRLEVMDAEAIALRVTQAGFDAQPPKR